MNEEKINILLHALIKKTIDNKLVTRTIVLAIFVCFVSVFVLSSVSIICHTDHVHDNNGINNTCLLCTLISNAKSLLKVLNFTGAGAYFLFPGFIGTLISLCCGGYMFSAVTPVELRTKIIN